MTARRRKKSREKFARLPRRVLESPACTSLPHAIFRVMVAYASEYHGHNNGSLGLTRAQAKKLGIGHDTLYRSQKMLEERGLLRLTRRGMRTPPVPNLYAITWEGIDLGKHDVQANPVPTREFEKWPDKSFSDDRPAVTAVTDHQSREPKKSAENAISVTDHQSRSANSRDRPADTSKTLATAEKKTAVVGGSCAAATARKRSRS